MILIPFVLFCVSLLGSASLSRWRRGNQKSSSEVYREAAQMLGLSCTLCDSCRCLDCQVGLRELASAALKVLSVSCVTQHA